jgi:hypothetical protein
MPQLVKETSREFTRPVESDFDLSGKLLEIEWTDQIPNYLPVVLPDVAKSNLSSTQHAALTVMSNCAEHIAFVGNELNLNLTSSQHFVVKRIGAKGNFSRGKGGWAGFLSKTNKSVSEEFLVQKAMEIQEAEQPQKKGIISKIFRR